MKLFASTKKLIDKTKNEENVPSLEVVEMVNQYQQKSEVLYTFTSNKSYAYLLNVEPSNFLFLKTYNAEFDEIIKTITDQNGRPLEIAEKVDLTLLITNRTDTLLYRTKTKKICQRMWIFDIR